MEKDNTRKLYRIVINGPESTGKTELSAALANYFKTAWMPELARTYVERLNRPYTEDDVIRIAREQVRQEQDYVTEAHRILFLDTDLIITKIWLKVVYGRFPAWIDDFLRSNPPDLYLLCQTDLPWVPDQVRENGGAMREILFKTYLSEIENLGCPCHLVEGTGPARLASALEGIRTHLSEFRMD